MYEEVKAENKSQKDLIVSLQNSLNSKTEESKALIEDKTKDLKNYLDRPFTMAESVLYSSTTLSTNLSTSALNNIVPAGTKKILLYVFIQSGGCKEAHGQINLFTKYNGQFNKRVLRLDGYSQNAYNSNSDMIEMDLDGGDYNLYFSSSLNYFCDSFSFGITLVGYK